MIEYQTLILPMRTLTTAESKYLGGTQVDSWFTYRVGEDTAQLEVDRDKQAPSEQQVVPHNKVSEIISETIDVLFNFLNIRKI